MFKLEEVTPEELTWLKNALPKNGVSVTWPNAASNTFNISGHDISGTAIYTPEKLELEISIVKKPFFVTEEHIQNGLVEIINAQFPKEPKVVLEHEPSSQIED